MKTVITSEGNSVNAEFDLRFGRAAYFCIVDENSGSVEFIPNIHKDSLGGAGTKASETILEHGVKKVISGDFGPKAKDVLEKFGVQMVILSEKPANVQAVIDFLKIK
ncbi:MAG: NifB/NifX family molybdenum-iron cluster-binding protein [Bacteroidales bacterium]